ncbi:MAG: hypothetical protein LJE95_04455 [Acidobacteria bacterium]|jgi:cytoskeletal protein RodZ|nr:hypothetical protein [Acidobacteriota bacterium]
MRTKSWLSLVLVAVLALGITMITACKKAEQPAPAAQQPAAEQPAPAAEQPTAAAEEPAEQTPPTEGTPAPEKSEAPQAPAGGGQK